MLEVGDRSTANSNFVPLSDDFREFSLHQHTRNRYVALGDIELYFEQKLQINNKVCYYNQHPCLRLRLFYDAATCLPAIIINIYTETNLHR